MTDSQKDSIICSGKDYFRKTIIRNHLQRFRKLRLKDFNINPFLINYTAALLCGNNEPESLAKALIYPRIIGTSLNTSFGQQLQIFISQIQEIVGGVLYGDKENLSASYKIIDSHYPVLCGAEFWQHLTGDDQFYYRLSRAFGEVVEEDGIDGSGMILEKINEIAEEIRNKGGL